MIDTASRTDRLLVKVEELGLDCLLVTNMVNVRYLTGFTGTNGACVITPEERLFLTDFRYVDQAGEQVRDTRRSRSAATCSAGSRSGCTGAPASTTAT